MGAFGGSKVGKSFVLLRPKFLFGKWPRTNWRVEQVLDTTGPSVAA